MLHNEDLPDANDNIKMNIRERRCNCGSGSRPMASCGITNGAVTSSYATVESHSLHIRSFA